MGVISFINEQKRWFYVVLAFIQAGLTAGIIFGFPELEIIFTREGVYEDHCASTDLKRPCEEQKLFYGLIFTIGVFANNAAPLLTGIFLDKFGPKLTSLASVVLFMSGCALFLISSPQAYVPGFALLGFSGPGIYVSIMHLNNLFPGNQALVLSFFSGTFTVSNFVFKVFKIMNGNNDWFTLAHLFICFIVILVPFFLIGGIFWPNKPFQLASKSVRNINDEEDSESLQQKAPLIEKKRDTCQ